MPSSSCANCHKSKKFDYEESSTFINNEEVIELQYGKGGAIGEICQDEAFLNGEKVGIQEFVLVRGDVDMDGMMADGIMGMAFEELSDLRTTVVRNMAKSGTIESASFSVYIGDNDYGRKKEKFPSNVIFGGHNLEKYSSDKSFTYINLIKTGYWSISLEKIKVDNSRITTKSQIAILDTGTSLLIGPSSEVDEIFDRIKENVKCKFDNLLICTCKDVNQLPVIEFVLDGHSFYLNPEEYTLKDGNQCLVLISTAPFKFWILGDVFLRSYYTLYDMDNEKVGIARSGTASDIKKNSTLFKYTMIILLILIVLGLVGFFIRYYYIKRRSPEQPREINIPLNNFRN